MRRPLLVSLTLAVTALPTLAFAAFETPSAILKSIITTMRPMDVSYEIHGEMPEEEMYATLWIKGTTKNNSLYPMHPESDLHFTLDVIAPKTKVRAKASMKVTGGTAYVHLDRVEGTYNDEEVTLAVQAGMHKWYMLPEMDSMTPADTEKATNMLMALADNLFTLKKQGAGYYVLTLKPNAANDLASMAADENLRVAGEELSSLLQNARAEMRVETTGDEVRIARFSFSLTDEKTKATLTGKGTTSVRWNSFTVTAPANAVSIEDAFNDFIPDFPMMDMTLPSDDWSTPPSDDTGWETTVPPSDTPSIPAPTWSGEGCASDDPSVRLNAVRRGDCGKPDESPRRLERKLRSTSSY